MKCFTGDLKDIGMFGHHPERGVALEFGAPERVVGAEPGERFARRTPIGIGRRVYHRACYII
jgi:hypothetical protein